MLELTASDLKNYGLLCKRFEIVVSKKTARTRTEWNKYSFLSEQLHKV